MIEKDVTVFGTYNVVFSKLAVFYLAYIFVMNEKMKLNDFRILCSTWSVSIDALARTCHYNVFHPI